MNFINTYLIFNGTCRQAMTFYQQCLGGELYTSTFGEMPGGCEGLPPETKDWLMHARLTIKNMILMASDTRPDMRVTQGDNFFVSINCENIAEAEKLFKALSQDGSIQMPLQETFWAVRFAMLTDKFGVKWMINLDKTKG